MDTWVWGPLVLHRHVVIIVAAAAMGYGVLQLRLRAKPERRSIAAAALNGALLWLLIWKWGWVLTDLSGVWNHPESLLYFSGGRYSAWLASAAAVLYVGIALEKRRIGRPVYIDSLLVSLFGGYVAYSALTSVQGDDILPERLSVALLGAIFLGIWLMKGKNYSAGTVAQRLLVLGIGCALVFTVFNQPGSAGKPEEAGGSGTAAKVGLNIGQEAPDFSLSLLGGGELKLSDYRGSVVYVNFWATWCPPCQAEMPYMQQFYTNNEKNGVVILGVNETQTEASVPVVEAWVDEWELTFPIPLDRDGAVGKLYRVQAYPATFVIDEQGIIRAKHPGPMNGEMLENALASIRKAK
ncbi:Peroxiredoxin [Paenibacillus sp. UNCCL117]|uniref:peroxiredoxin family protein n=1 Tax=unclassified Paenibacillus TaxID=185978 RepID=UPI00088D5AF1|nr:MULTISPECIES: redoxin domain-containing protein [unclassified Paenibacillus]SDD79672.1 Peroxiredoxin [Paenibacillus sp. cl123]SFW53256.1 Peroxiredoxin [Paenibacillus sp. UNCCL117]